jgi:hypothetical protein
VRGCRSPCAGSVRQRQRIVTSRSISRPRLSSRYRSWAADWLCISRNGRPLRPGQRPPRRSARERPVDHHRCCDLVMAQGGDECGELPVAVRCLSDQSLAFRRAAAQARHVRAGAGFINENQSPRVDRGLLLSPFLTRCFDVFAVLFGGVQRFFKPPGCRWVSPACIVCCRRHTKANAYNP